MFFRETYSKSSQKPVLQLIQTCRTPKAPRQRVVVSLGTKINIPKNLRSQVAQLVEDQLKGQKSLFKVDPKLMIYCDRIIKKIQTDGKWRSERKQVKNFQEDKEIAQVFIDQVEHSQDRMLGPLLIGHHFWKRLYFPNILADCGFNDSQIGTAELSVLSRLIEQCSEHATPAWIKTVAAEEIVIKDAETFSEDRFYHISDKLLKNKDRIEIKLYRRQKSLFNLEDCIFLYDLTNTYFEGICALNPKAQFNKNQKEKRTDCRQVVVALSLDGEGFVRKHQVFEGNMSDCKSLKEILEALKDDFQGKSLPTIIFDRGVVTEENIKLIESCNLKYIVSSRSGEEKRFLTEFEEGEFKTLKDEGQKVEILLKKEDGISYLLCKSEGRCAKERSMRNRREQKLEEELVSCQLSSVG